MKSARMLAVTLGTLLLAISASAQDQVIVINDELQRLPPQWTTTFGRDGLTLNNESAGRLIGDTLGRDLPLSDPNFYCIIHLLKWKSSGTGERAVEKQAWFLYRGGVWSQKEFEGKRVFGSRKVAILFIHLNARDLAAYKSPTYRIEVTKKLPAPIQGLIDLINLGGTIPSALTRKLVEPVDLYGGKLMPPIEHVPSNVTVKALVPSAQAAVSLNANAAAVETAEAAATSEAAATTAEEANRNARPTIDPRERQRIEEAATTTRQRADEARQRADEARQRADKARSEAASARQQDDATNLQEIATQTYDNEGLYHWDVSVGLPVSKIKELEFNAQDGTVRPKEIDKQKLFAFFNFYIKPIDTKGTHVERWPHPIVGVALSKKPLDRIFVGGGYGLNKVDFFVGCAFNKVQSPATLTTGASATQSQLESDLKTKYQPKLVFGLNLPLRQVIDKLKSK